MKKAMLFLVAFMFSVSASAATLSLSTGGSNNASQSVSAIVNNGSVALGSGETAGGAWTSFFDLVSDEATKVRVEWSFNPESAVTSAMLGFDGEFFNVTGDFTRVFDITAGLHFVDFMFVNSSALSYDISVSEVPVPAAAFLFAPALIGFMGLRRKAAKVA